MFVLPSNDGNYIYGTCRATELDGIDIVCVVKKYDAGRKCRSILKEAKTVIVVGNVVTPEMDVCKKGILGEDFPSYQNARIRAKELAAQLQAEHYRARVTVGISIKNACVLSGIGVYGKNALIINPEHGTYLRYACVLTDWVPEQYGVPLQDFSPCESCDACITACPGQCLKPFVVDGPKCMCTYIEKGQKPLTTLPMCSVCQDVCKLNGRETY